MRLNLLWHRGCKVYQVCSNDDPRMTFESILQHSQISALVAVAILVEFFMASADINGQFAQMSESLPMGLLFTKLTCTAVSTWIRGHPRGRFGRKSLPKLTDFSLS